MDLTPITIVEIATGLISTLMLVIVLSQGLFVGHRSSFKWMLAEIVSIVTFLPVSGWFIGSWSTLKSGSVAGLLGFALAVPLYIVTLVVVKPTDEEAHQRAAWDIQSRLAILYWYRIGVFVGVVVAAIVAFAATEKELILTGMIAPFFIGTLGIFIRASFAHPDFGIVLVLLIIGGALAGTVVFYFEKWQAENISRRAEAQERSDFIPIKLPVPPLPLLCVL